MVGCDSGGREEEERRDSEGAGVSASASASVAAGVSTACVGEGEGEGESTGSGRMGALVSCSGTSGEGRSAGMSDIGRGWALMSLDGDSMVGVGGRSDDLGGYLVDGGRRQATGGRR